MRAPVLSSLDEAAEWAAYCKARGKALPAAIHIDTGMTRLGLPEEQVRRLAQTPELLSAFNLCLIVSHLACGDEPSHPKNEDQLARFAELTSLFPGVPRSLANSAGILLGPAFSFRSGPPRHRALRRAARVNWAEPDGARALAVRPHRGGELGRGRARRWATTPRKRSSAGPGSRP